MMRPQDYAGLTIRQRSTGQEAVVDFWCEDLKKRPHFIVTFSSGAIDMLSKDHLDHAFQFVSGARAA